MKKIKLFFVHLFIVVCASYNIKAEPCPTLKITGPDTFCGPGPYEGWYGIDFYNKSTVQVWFIEGGTILEVDLEGYNKYDNTQMFCQNCTTYVYTGSDKIEDDIANIKCDGEGCEFEVNPIALFDYLDADNQGLLVPAKLKIRWNPGAPKHNITVYAAGLGVAAFCSEMHTGKSINFTSAISSSWTLSSGGNSSPTCDQGINISGAPSQTGFTTNWGWDPGVNVNNTWQTGAYINNFSILGGAKIWATVTDACGTAVYKELNLNIQSKSAGPLLDNTGQSPIYAIVPDANGIFQLRLSNYINGASYQWILPNTYQAGTGYINKTLSSTSNQITGLMPSNALQDYTGKVIKTGVCGYEEFPYTVKALEQVSVPSSISSCSNTADIYLDNGPYTLYSAWESTRGTPVKLIGNNQVELIAPGPGIYNVCYSIQNVTPNRCTKVTIGGSSTSSQWQEGTLSPLTKDVASNLCVTGVQGYEQIYFTDKSGSLWYYQFDNGVNKWIPNQININPLALTNGVSPTYHSLAVDDAAGFIYYVNNSNRISYINPRYGTTASINGNYINPGKLCVDDYSYVYMNRSAYFRNGDGLIYRIPDVSNASPLSPNIYTDNEELYFNSGFLYYVSGGNIWRWNANNNTTSQLTNSGNGFPAFLSTSDIRVYSNKLYYVASTKRIVEVDLSNSSWTYITPQPIPTPSFNGAFDINPSSGVIYARGSGSSGRGGVQPDVILRVNKSGNTWSVITGILSSSGTSSSSDYISASPVVYNRHVFYVSTNTTTDGNINSVWNLYLNTNCTPSVFRKAPTGSDDIKTQTSIVAFPNPFSSSLELQMTGDDTQGYHIMIYNSLGVKIKELTSNSSNINIPTNDFIEGAYLVKIYNGENLLATQKVVKR